MIRPCLQCSQTFEITDGDLAFYDKVSPVFNGRKEAIPPPTLCPECRQRRRLSFRNERRLYNDRCDLCGKDMISVYSPDKPWKVYCQSCWWGDGWDASSLAVEINPDVPFFDQFRSLQETVPRINLMNARAQNAEYCNYSNGNKDSYLLVGSGDCDGCMYMHRCWSTKDSIDCSNANQCQLCYGLVDCVKCYHSFFLQSSSDCIDCELGYGLQGCQDCFGCANLQRARFHIFNQPYDRDGYEKEVARLRLLPADQVQGMFDVVMSKAIRKNLTGANVDDCTGDNIVNSKRAHDCYRVKEVQDCRWVSDATRQQDCYDVEYSDMSELAYEAINNESKFSAFYHTCWMDHSVFYCTLCFHSSHLFGCVGMKRAQYCILNRQYTKEEYEALVPKIIERMRKDGEWGEFFDPSLSPFGYNETVAQEYYPLEREEALRLGFNWSDYVSPPPQVEKIVKAAQLPDGIKDIPDAILEWAVECEVSGRPFRIIKQELKFLREHGLPLPRRHPDVRHLDRMKLRNPRKLFDRSCMKCSKPISTTYAPDRPEKVYCEECYLKEVY